MPDEQFAGCKTVRVELQADATGLLHPSFLFMSYLLTEQVCILQSSNSTAQPFNSINLQSTALALSWEFRGTARDTFDYGCRSPGVSGLWESLDFGSKCLTHVKPWNGIEAGLAKHLVLSIKDILWIQRLAGFQYLQVWDPMRLQIKCLGAAC